MKIFIDRTKGNYIPKSRYRVKTNNIADHFLDIVKNHEIHSRENRPDTAAIFTCEQDGICGENFSCASQGTNFLSRKINIIPLTIKTFIKTILNKMTKIKTTY